eukprot:c426_g1_i1.p1 GENE.c426_g1_i1~~c426_g1_i1.p1  ORF type:complete len:712 (+),score=112.32 c426_g1_i1:137-2272(+)
MSSVLVSSPQPNGVVEGVLPSEKGNEHERLGTGTAGAAAMAAATPMSPLAQDLSKNMLFAFNSFEYAQIFSDIRGDDDPLRVSLSLLPDQNSSEEHDGQPIVEMLSTLSLEPSARMMQPLSHASFSTQHRTDTTSLNSLVHAGLTSVAELELDQHEAFASLIPHDPSFSPSLDGKGLGEERHRRPSNPWSSPVSGLTQSPTMYPRPFPQQHPNRASKSPHMKPMSASGIQITIRTPSELIGKVTTLCKDQNGCRHLQSLLDEGSLEFTNVIFGEVLAQASTLMVDPFGNYLCQKLVEKCDDEQRVRFIGAVSSSLVHISLNIHGTRAVQKVIDCVEKPEQIEMVALALGTDVVPLVKDLNGNHVIQRCLQKFGPERCQFIFDAVACHLVDVATHRHGCCVLQRCIDHANDFQRKLLVTEIATNALRLVQDPFGNYVVQYVLDLFPPDEQAMIVVKFVGSVTHLSTQKFSSNVMEKCLELAEAPVRQQFLEEICRDHAIPILLNDPYGNYVIQRALGVADTQMFDKLCGKIRPHISSLRSTPNGKRIYSKLMKKFPMIGLSPASMPSPQSGMMVHPAMLNLPPIHRVHYMQGRSNQQAPGGASVLPYSPPSDMDPGSPYGHFVNGSPNHMYEYRQMHHIQFPGLGHPAVVNQVFSPPPMPSLPPSAIPHYMPLLGAARGLESDLFSFSDHDSFFHPSSALDAEYSNTSFASQ